MVPLPVLANWKFTKWGMTKADLQKAAPIKLKSGRECPVNNSNTPGALQVEFSSSVKVGSMNFIACYLFRNSKLHSINLFSRDVDAKAVVNGLSQKYGVPEINRNLQEIGIITYKWDKFKETIEFSDSSHSKVKILYPYVISYTTKNGSNESAVRDKL